MPVPASSQLPPFLSSTLLRPGGAGLDDLPTPLAPKHDASAGVELHLAPPQPDAASSSSRPRASSSPSSNHSTPRVAVLPLPSEGEQTIKTAALNKTTLSSTTPVPLLLVPPLNFDMICGGRTTRGPSSSSSAASSAAKSASLDMPPSSATYLPPPSTMPSSSSSSSSSSPSSSTTLTSSALYRSGHPNERNEPFLSTLGLRTIIYLATDQVRPNLSQFASSSGIRLVHVELNVNKEPFAEMDTESVLSALDVILDKRNLPCLVHCNKGKYRVGVITAIIRRLQGWSLTSIYDEYARFAGGDRVADEEFIDMFPLHRVKRPEPAHAPDWL